jgi:hypothetical protein
MSIYIKTISDFVDPSPKKFDIVYWKSTLKNGLVCSSQCPSKTTQGSDFNFYCSKYDLVTTEAIRTCLKDHEIEILLWEL